MEGTKTFHGHYKAALCGRALIESHMILMRKRAKATADLGERSYPGPKDIFVKCKSNYVEEQLFTSVACKYIIKYTT